MPSPSTSAPINNVEQLVVIYDNATAFINETNPFVCYSNDDADLTLNYIKLILVHLLYQVRFL